MGGILGERDFEGRKEGKERVGEGGRKGRIVVERRGGSRWVAELGQEEDGGACSEEPAWASEEDALGPVWWW